MMLALPHGRRAPGQDAAEGQVAERVGRGVLLCGVVVDVLAAVGGVGAGHPGLRALADQAASPCAPGRCPSRSPGHPVKAGVPGHLGALGAEHPALLAEVLAADVAEVGTVADDQLSDHR